MRAALIFLLFLVIIGLPGALTWVWTLQNAHETARLSLNLGSLVGAWETSRPVPVPTLMGGAFGVGVLTGIALMGGWSLARALRRRSANQPGEVDPFLADM